MVLTGAKTIADISEESLVREVGKAQVEQFQQ
jgi:L-lactate dehydrogenase (cytochrome)